MELSLLDYLVMWWSGVCIGFVCLRVFVNASWGLNADKQMPTVGASSYNVAFLSHTSLPPYRPTPGHTMGVLERGKQIFMIHFIFNKLIMFCVLHPWGILKWLSHSSVMLLIDRGRKGAQEGGMIEGTREGCGGWGMAMGQIRQSWNNCLNKIPTVFFLDRAVKTLRQTG